MEEMNAVVTEEVVEEVSETKEPINAATIGILAVAAFGAYNIAKIGYKGAKKGYSVIKDKVEKRKFAKMDIIDSNAVNEKDFFEEN